MIAVASLLGDDSLAAGFEGGELTIFRLAPADYHRFASLPATALQPLIRVSRYNAPVDCVVGPTRSIEGDYYVRAARS